MKDFTVTEHLVICELSVSGKQNAKFKVDRALRNDIWVKLSYYGYAGIQEMTHYLTNMTEKIKNHEVIKLVAICSDVRETGRLKQTNNKHHLPTKAKLNKLRCESTSMSYLLFLQHQQILRRDDNITIIIHNIQHFRQRSPRDQDGCYIWWRGWLTRCCSPHLLNLRVKDLPGAFLKPVHVHCTGSKERDKRGVGKGCLGSIGSSLEGSTERWAGDVIRGVLILLVLFPLIRRQSVDATQAEEFIISCFMYCVTPCYLSIMKSAPGTIMCEAVKYAEKPCKQCCQTEHCNNLGWSSH